MIRMNQEFKETFGVWTQAIGTLISAISDTPSLHLDELKKNQLSLIGNVMQATGNAILADSEEEISLGKIGNQIQAIGNSTIVIGIFSNEQETKNNLELKGNLLQAFGSAIALPDLIYIENKSLDDVLNIYAALLQSIGNSLQALSVKFGQKGKGETINFVGSWIQTTGAFIQVLAQNNHDSDKESSTFAKNHDDTDKESSTFEKILTIPPYPLLCLTTNQKESDLSCSPTKTFESYE